ncbi:MAG: transposase domain-containing protein [Actinomycetota bacterium]|nr:transposase domain-containing protein [Actinomycetota bacterium]
MHISVAERLALAALVAAVPADLVDAALDRADHAAQRVRSLPPRVTVYHLLASALYPSKGYDEVTALVWSVLPAATGRGLSRQLPSRGAITRARQRLGCRPLQALLAEQLSTAVRGTPPSRVYLDKFDAGPDAQLWWLCDAVTEELRGCRLGGDIGTAAELVAGAGPDAVVLCAPQDVPTGALLDLLGRTVPVSRGELPGRVTVPWADLRARTPAAWRQDALARACVRAGAETALQAPRHGRGPLA